MKHFYKVFLTEIAGSCKLIDLLHIFLDLLQVFFTQKFHILGCDEASLCGDRVYKSFPFQFIIGPLCRDDADS